MANPFRFSTKFQDDETGLLYYGYRYYDPSTGRWNSRDPIQERGGNNLYGFVGNDPCERADRLGQDYYIYKIKGVCGVNHRVLVADDGDGNSYEIQLYPLVTKLTEEIRRICGKGIITYVPRTGNATNWISGEGVTLEKHVETSSLADKGRVERAKELSSKEVTYCLGLQDCRHIEECLINQKLGEKIENGLKMLLEIFFMEP